MTQLPSEHDATNEPGAGLRAWLGFASRVLHPLAVAALVFLAAIGFASRLGGPPASLIGNLVVDDAFYYAVPARHLVEGGTFSFDGERPSNGVQPLWAGVVIALAAVVRDDVLLVRLMAGVSALCWFAAAVVLYRALRGWGRWMALLAAIGWALAAFSGRVAFQGMENGLHALLMALIVWYGVTRLRNPACFAARDRTFYLVLGLLLALFTLCRIDSGLLALLVGAGVLLGLIHASGRIRLHLNLSGAIWLALPGIILVGGYALFSFFYFGIATPISGAVKLHYAREWGPAHGGALGSVVWHLWHVFLFATDVPARHAMARLVLLLVLLVGGTAGLWTLARSRFAALRRASSWQVFVAVLAVFVVARLCVYAVVLPHFTQYGTWYFAPEIMAVWVAVAIALHSAVGYVVEVSKRARARKDVNFAEIACGCLLGLLCIGAIRDIVLPPAHDPRTHVFQVGADWIDHHAPADQKLAAFSAGILGFCARDHQVINLDGLINDLDYFENYLSRDRFADYARERDVRYLCDYAPLDVWRKGGFWGFATADMRLAHWWRMKGDLAYCIWELPILSEGEPRFTGVARDALSQFQYAAEVEQRYAVLSEADLARALEAGELVGRRVVTSIPVWPDLSLRHVVLPDADAAALELMPAELDISHRCDAVFGERVELLGYDVPATTVRPGSRLLFTRFWRIRSGDATLDGATIVTRLTPGQANQNGVAVQPDRLVHVTRGCHDTYPVSAWRAGELVVETYAIEVGKSMPRGSYALTIALHDSKGREIASKTTNSAPEQPSLFITNIRVE